MSATPIQSQPQSWLWRTLTSIRLTVFLLLLLAALAATLRDFFMPQQVTERNPVWQMLTASRDSLRERAERLKSALEPLAPWQVLELRDSEAEAGSGTMPTITIPSIAICCLPQGNTASRWARHLRQAAVPVVATVKQDLVWFDLRTISDSEITDLIQSVAAAQKHSE